eukprot:g4171.t1
MAEANAEEKTGRNPGRLRHKHRACNVPHSDGAWVTVSTINTQMAAFRWLVHPEEDRHLSPQQLAAKEKVNDLMRFVSKRGGKVTLLSDVSAHGCTPPTQWSCTWGPFRVFGTTKVAVVVHKSLLISPDGTRVVQPPRKRFGPRLLAVYAAGVWWTAAYQPPYLATAARLEEIEKLRLAREKLLCAVGTSNIVLGGDWNAALGQENRTQEMVDDGAVGTAELLQGAAAETGKEAMEFAQVNGLAIPDTFKQVHARGTWWRARSSRWHELDYFYVSRRMHFGRVTTVTPTFRTDHRMKTMFVVVGRTHAQRRAEAEARRQRAQTKLPFLALRRDHQVRAAYAWETDRQLQHEGPRPPSDDVDKSWERLENTIGAAARTAIPHGRERLSREYPPWVDAQDLEAHRREREQLLEARNASEDAGFRRECNRNVRALGREYKRRDEARFAEYVENLAAKSADEWRRCPRTDYKRLRDTGVLYRHVTTPQQQEQLPFTAEQAKQHFSALMLRPGVVPDGFTEMLDRHVPQLPRSTEQWWGIPSEAEIAEVVKSMNDCTTGHDTAHKLHVLNLGEIAWGEFVDLIQEIFRQKKLPGKTQLVKMIALFKGKGLDPKQLTNYRAIALICLLSKIVESISQKRMTWHLESIGFWDEVAPQRGFRPDCSTCDLVVVLNMLADMARTEQRYDLAEELVFVLIDFKKAFPSVVRECVYQILGRTGMPEEDISALRTVHESAQFCMHLGDEESERWGSTRGFTEGGCSSPSLYNVLSAPMYKEMASRMHGVKYIRAQELVTRLLSVSDHDPQQADEIVKELIALLFADDATFPTQYKHAEETEEAAAEVARVFGQEMHPDKTERLLIRSQHTVDGDYEGPQPRGQSGPLLPVGYQSSARIVGCDITDRHSAEGQFRRHMTKAQKRPGPCGGRSFSGCENTTASRSRHVGPC